MMDWLQLTKLYIPLIAWVGSGWWLGRVLPPVIPYRLGKFLFWIGVPLSILGFLRQADLSASVWLAPITAWIAVGLGLSLGWIWLQIQSGWQELQTPLSHNRDGKPTLDRLLGQTLMPPSQGSFLLSTMFGNTGYLGYPIALALIGTQYFGWTVFYDTLGSALSSYSVGVVLAAQFGSQMRRSIHLAVALLKNPALWSFWLGLGLRNVSLPPPIEQGLHAGAWTIVGLSLLLLGMRLSQLTSQRYLATAMIGLMIKMAIVPLLIGFGLPYLGITGTPRLAIVIQAAMPPAFATLVLAEAYDLDRDLTVTTLALGSLLILLTLPIWLLLFSP
ncbi:MAG: AEC family transporter [Elainella sp. Prado103]|jgi:hypothetical protein|nr:AEC family transporter [Elainella sp. Prado103]